MTEIVFYQPKPAPTPIIYYKGTGKVPISTPLSKLSPGQSLSPGESLVSPDKVFTFIFQTDGNLVLLNRTASIWTAGVPGQGAVKLEMQNDGNLVLYDAIRRPLWATMTQGHPGSFFQVQNDGNSVLYQNETPLWETRTWGGAYHEEGGSWLSEAIKTAGRPFADAAHFVSEGFKDVGEALGDIPIVGPLFHGVFTIVGGPFSFTDQIIQGERLDRALINDFRDKLTAVREIAPYAQTVLSFVPGIGTGVAAAIGAGLALAQGMPIDEAVLQGVKSALPGGPAARAAFTLTVAAASGKNLIQAAGDTTIEALGLPPEATEGLHKALNVAYKASQGENIPLAALQEARSYLPTQETKQAFDVAVAMAEGKRLQDALIEQIGNMTPDQKSKIVGVGLDLIEKTPALQAARNAVSKSSDYLFQASRTPIGKTAKQGYEFGIGVMRHGGVNEQSLTALRNKLTPTEQQGFDVAVATYRAAVTTHVSNDVPVAKAAGYLVAKGLTGNPNPMVKEQSLKFFIIQPDAREGISQAIARAKAKRESFWTWLLRLVHLR